MKGVERGPTNQIELIEVHPIARTVWIGDAYRHLVYSLSVTTDRMVLHYAVIPHEHVSARDWWTITDDVGTPYESVGLGGGGHDDVSESHATFEPSPPPDARVLRLINPGAPDSAFELTIGEGVHPT